MKRLLREDLSERLEWFQQRIQELGAYSSKLILKEPAAEGELSDFEKILGQRIPEEFRNVLLNLSSHLEFYWNLYSEEEHRMLLPLPEPLQSIFSGNLHFSLKEIWNAEESRKDWISILYSDLDHPYARVYHNKLAFYRVGNGDLIAIDLDEESYGKIVYLSHDGDEMHGYVLAESFTEWLEEWTRLGCVGGECWQWEAFTNNRTTGIDSRCENAALWLRTIGRV